MRPKNNIFLLIGCPASGKSYFRSKYLNNYDYISCDEIREREFGFIRTYAIREKTTCIIKNEIFRLVSEEKDFVIDSTYFNCANERKFFFKEKINYNIIAIFINVSFYKIVIQNTRRPPHRLISFRMLRKFYNEIQPPEKEEGFSLVFDIKIK